MSFLNSNPSHGEGFWFGSLALSIKEGLRGVRHIGLSLRRWIAGLFSKMPRPVQTVSDAAIAKFDRIADKVEHNTSAIAHRYLDPAIARNAEAAVLTRLVRHDDASASVLFAKVMYDNLKTATAYNCKMLNVQQHFFISEMLGAVAYGRAAAAIHSATNDHGKAAELLAGVHSIGVIRTSTGANAVHSTDPGIRDVAHVASFAAILWLIVERDNSPSDEEMLLIDCCDLALAKSEEIEATGATPQGIESLLAECAKIV